MEQKANLFYFISTFSDRKIPFSKVFNLIRKFIIKHDILKVLICILKNTLNKTAILIYLLKIKSLKTFLEKY